MKADELIIGKKYYFDAFEVDYGEFLGHDETYLIFKPIINNIYWVDPSDGTVQFEIAYSEEMGIDEWHEVEE